MDPTYFNLNRLRYLTFLMFRFSFSSSFLPYGSRYRGETIEHEIDVEVNAGVTRICFSKTIVYVFHTHFIYNFFILFGDIRSLSQRLNSETLV